MRAERGDMQAGKALEKHGCAALSDSSPSMIEGYRPRVGRRARKVCPSLRPTVDDPVRRALSPNNTGRKVIGQLREGRARGKASKIATLDLSPVIRSVRSEKDSEGAGSATEEE